MPSGKRPRYNTLTSWSFSTYTNYLKCPFQVCLEKIVRTRIEEPENPAFVKGNRVHEAADAFISGRAPARKKLEAELQPVAAKLKDLRAVKASTEQEWAFDRNWEPCDWRDWNRAWVRIKTDVCAATEEPPHVEIIDWKTGRVHAEDHRLQRRLYATGGLQLVQAGALCGGDRAADCTAQHIYVETGQTATETFKMKELAGLKREWASRVKPMMTDTLFPAKTGHHCRWCKFRKSNGGPCPENM